MNDLPEIRRKKLKELLHTQKHIRAMETASALAGLVVEHAEACGREYNAMWLSSLCDALMRGRPDNEFVDFTDRINTIQQVFAVTTKPLIMDCDTGGKTEHFVERIQLLEQLGVSAVVIEDKKGLKRNSLLGDGVRHFLEEKEQFAEKIRRGKAALRTEDFMIFARIEGLITGMSINEVLERADAYVDAGADGIMIHSRSNNGEDVMEYLRRIRKKYPELYTIAVPTAYPQIAEETLFHCGANIVIYANHLLRSAYHAMQITAKQILCDGNCLKASRVLCTPVDELFALVEEIDD